MSSRSFYFELESVRKSSLAEPGFRRREGSGAKDACLSGRSRVPSLPAPMCLDEDDDSFSVMPSSRELLLWKAYPSAITVPALLIPRRVLGLSTPGCGRARDHRLPPLSSIAP